MKILAACSILIVLEQLLVVGATVSNVKIQQESFTDWRTWAEKYPDCSPEVNRYLSPIHISVKDSNLTRILHPIFIHSQLPVADCLTLSMIYQQDDLEMEAVNINVVPSCVDRISFISGAGESKLESRYFKRALILFGSSGGNMQPELSLHQIDGKQVQMEIVMEFWDDDEKSCTQIHVMVEANTPDETPENPIFKTLEASLLQLKQEIINDATGKTSKGHEYKQLEKACQDAQNLAQKFLNESKAAENSAERMVQQKRLKELEKILFELKGIKDEDLKKLTQTKESVTIQMDLDIPLPVREEELEALREIKSDLIESMEEEKDLEVLENLKNNFTRTLVDIQEVELHEAQRMTPRKDQANAEPLEIVDGLKELLRFHKVGFPGEDKPPGTLFESPDAVHQELEELRNKINPKNESEQQPCIQLAKVRKKRLGGLGTVTISDPFQISWLFPRTSGYFLYNGSNPIPKCERRKHTIVLETPIKITTDQLSIFRSLPSLRALRNSSYVSGKISAMDEQFRVKASLPIIRPHYRDLYRRIWRVTKSHVFLGDDAYHPEAIWHHPRSLKEEKSGCGKITTKSAFLHAITLSLIFTISS